VAADPSPSPATQTAAIEPPPEWNFAVIDTDRSTGWSNHAYCYQVAFVGYGDGPAEAFEQAQAAGEIPEALEADSLQAWPTHAERSVELTADGRLIVVDDPPAERSRPTREQALALGDLMRRFSASTVDVNCHPFDLPEGWLYVALRLPSGPDFHAGIDPEGRVSS
jgi:hypothetical protein